MRTDIKNNFIKEKLRNICLEDIKEQTETMLERQRFYGMNCSGCGKCGGCSCGHTGGDGGSKNNNKILSSKIKENIITLKTYS